MKKVVTPLTDKLHLVIYPVQVFDSDYFIGDKLVYTQKVDVVDSETNIVLKSDLHCAWYLSDGTFVRMT